MCSNPRATHRVWLMHSTPRATHRVWLMHSTPRATHRVWLMRIGTVCVTNSLMHSTNGIVALDSLETDAFVVVIVWIRLNKNSTLQSDSHTCMDKYGLCTNLNSQVDFGINKPLHDIQSLGFESIQYV
jgi:hypothetical protein